MSQIPLLSIREQPNKQEAPIKSKTIRAYVRESLRGFRERQQAREASRDRELQRDRKARKAAEQKATMPTLFDMEAPE